MPRRLQHRRQGAGRANDREGAIRHTSSMQTTAVRCYGAHRGAARFDARLAGWDRSYGCRPFSMRTTAVTRTAPQRAARASSTACRPVSFVSVDPRRRMLAFRSLCASWIATMPRHSPALPRRADPVSPTERRCGRARWHGCSHVAASDRSSSPISRCRDSDRARPTRREIRSWGVNGRLPREPASASVALHARDLVRWRCRTQGRGHGCAGANHGDLESDSACITSERAKAACVASQGHHVRHAG